MQRRQSRQRSNTLLRNRSVTEPTRPLRKSRSVAQKPQKTRKHKPDFKIIAYSAVLVMIGLIIIFAIGPQRANLINETYGGDLSGGYFIIKQVISVAVALAAFLFFSFFFKVSWLIKFSKEIFIAGIVASLLLFILGNILHVDAIAKCTLGACRWFNIPGFGTFQPAELLKFGVLLSLAVFLAKRHQMGLIKDRDKTIIPAVAILAVAAFFVIVLQKDLGTGIALISIVASMLMVAGIGWKSGLTLFMIGLISAVLLIVAAPHRMARVATFLKGDTTTASDSGAYHITHAKIAIGSGGLLGVGVGNSVQAAGYLPEAINDSVFAILAETFGFVGVVAILTLFYLLLLRLIKIMKYMPDMKARLIVAGVFGWLSSHVIINIAAMIGLAPLTGITLPFLSFGGTSMLFMSAALGVVFELSRYTSHTPINDKQEGHDEDTRSRRGVGRTRYASRSRI